LPSGLDPSTVEGASSEDAMNFERVPARANVPACAIHLPRFLGSNFARSKQYISIIMQSLSLIISLPHPQSYFFSLRQSHYHYQAELFLSLVS
jgi:hypothetical protein